MTRDPDVTQEIPLSVVRRAAAGLGAAAPASGWYHPCRKVPARRATWWRCAMPEHLVVTCGHCRAVYRTTTWETRGDR